MLTKKDNNNNIEYIKYAFKINYFYCNYCLKGKSLNTNIYFHIPIFLVIPYVIQYFLLIMTHSNKKI